jgi:hypothetical protein
MIWRVFYRLNVLGATQGPLCLKGESVVTTPVMELDPQLVAALLALEA